MLRRYAKQSRAPFGALLGSKCAAPPDQSCTNRMGRPSESTGGTPNLSRPGTFGAGGFATNNPRMLVMVFWCFCLAGHLQYLTRASLQARSKKRTTPSTRTGPSALFSPGPIPWSRGLRSSTGTPSSSRQVVLGSRLRCRTSGNG